MDWLDLATELIAGDTRPVLVLDRTGMVRLVNGAFETLSKTSSTAIVGRTWADLQHSARIDTEVSLAELLQAPAASRRSRIALKSGRVFEIDWSSVPVGVAPAQGVVLRVLKANDRRQPRPPSDLAYRLQANDLEVAEIWSAVQGTSSGSRCFEVLLGNPAACPGCPVALLSRFPGDIQAAVLPSSGRVPLRIVTAERLEDGGAAVSATFVDDIRYRQLFSQRILAIADRAQLTAREREVLQGLVTGRSLHDLAAELGITTRTAKFHQARILGKLGADSRIDLFRLVS